MVAIITGDIVNSKQVTAELWLDVLKKELRQYGRSPQNWEIFRGDSFQLEVEPKDALKVAISIKSILKQINDLDVRMAIGIGMKDYSSNKITESNGSAFVNSGECFELLKKNTLAIKTPWSDFDEMMNTMIDLSLITMDSWSTKSAKFVKIGLDNPKMNQNELSGVLNKTQSTISEGLKRAAFDEILKMIIFYSKKINEKC